MHILAFVVQIVPDFLLARKFLFTSEDIKDFERIRSYYESDWEFCKRYQL